MGTWKGAADMSPDPSFHRGREGCRAVTMLAQRPTASPGQRPGSWVVQLLYILVCVSLGPSQSHGSSCFSIPCLSSRVHIKGPHENPL